MNFLVKQASKRGLVDYLEKDYGIKFWRSPDEEIYGKSAKNVDLSLIEFKQDLFFGKKGILTAEVTGHAMLKYPSLIIGNKKNDYECSSFIYSLFLFS